MSNLRLADRYAKSLIDLSSERGQLDKVREDMIYIQNLCKASVEFVNVLRSPIIKADQKENIILALTKGKVTDLTAAFNSLLIKKGRERDLPSIANAFISQYNALKGIHMVKLTTAVEVSDEMKNSIQQSVQKANNFEKVELETFVDASLIGGFKLSFNNKMVDASVANDLREIKKQFTKNYYVQNMR